MPPKHTRKLDLDAVEELERLEAEECRRSFKAFVQRAWRECDPDELIWNWHMEAICDHLQAVAEGRMQLLLINIPPGHAKSMLVSVLWPVWRWIREPWWRVMTASYEIGLANRDAVKSRTLILSPWFQKHFAFHPKTKQRWELKDDQNNKSFYENTALGFRISLSVGGKATGYRGTCLIVDDPLNMNDASSKVKRDEVILWKTETMASRFNDIANREEVVIMQRLHEDDLSGYIIKAGGWQHLCLPSEFEEAQRSRTYALPKGKTIRQSRQDSTIKPQLFFTDPRTYEGELLFPERYPKIALDEAKTPRGMGPVAYAGQHQQRPMPVGGGAVKESYFMRRWHMPGTEAPAGTQLKHGYTRREYDPTAYNPRCQRILVSDLAFKKAEDNDLVAIGIFDIVYPDALLVDWLWDRMSFVESLRAIKHLRSKWSAPGMPFVRKVGIEDRANGSAVIEVLKREIPGVFPIEPLGSKEARIEAAATFLAAGNVWFPEAHPQIDEGIHQALVFPKGSHDDWIDMVAYGILLGLAGNKLGYLERLARW